ncbi:MAG: malonyl CoA-acyl carrier protein transacylase, partial [Devosiaceae bacterium]|nr:malonyl CoA-acyl carrier protein transacylase [Devosiaceae bacterium]
EGELAHVQWGAPGGPVISNVTVTPVSDPAQIRKNLIAQVTGMVRWSETIAWLTSQNDGQGGVTQLLEIGSGKVLSGLARRINREAETVAIGTPEGIENFVAALNGE